MPILKLKQKFHCLIKQDSTDLLFNEISKNANST